VVVGSPCLPFGAEFRPFAHASERLSSHPSFNCMWIGHHVAPLRPAGQAVWRPQRDSRKKPLERSKEMFSPAEPLRRASQRIRVVRGSHRALRLALLSPLRRPRFLAHLAVPNLAAVPRRGSPMTISQEINHPSRASLVPVADPP
jgi:hypothetical protein